jgi:hypothetical protein
LELDPNVILELHLRYGGAWKNDHVVSIVSRYVDSRYRLTFLILSDSKVVANVVFPSRRLDLALGTGWHQWSH